MESELRELLRPVTANRVIDLVQEAGLDVSDWANFNGNSPASNPKYCYEWCFTQKGKPVVLNIWLEEIDFETYDVPSLSLNMREFSSNLSAVKGRKTLSNRAYKFDEALKFALRNDSSISVVICDGTREDVLKPENETSKVSLRVLDSEVWSLAEYDMWTGQARIHRKPAQKYVDQHSLETLELRAAKKLSVETTAYLRDRKIRDAVLERAQGRCELCNEEGFKTKSGYRYLETHHIIPLSEGGDDHITNVVALCPRDHRMAHFSVNAKKITEKLLSLPLNVSC